MLQVTSKITNNYVYQFAKAAVTKNHKLGVFKGLKVLSHSSGGQKSEIKVLAVWVPSEGCEGRIGSRPLSLACKDGLFMLAWCSPCMYAYIPILSLYENTSH